MWYVFDEHKNIVDKDNLPVSVPTILSDGSVLFYDRGAQYGEYRMTTGGNIIRKSEGADSGSYWNENWRYLICDQHDLLGSNRFQWGL